MTQVIVMTSDKSQNQVLPGFAWLFNKYWGSDQKVEVCGFTAPTVALPDNFRFFSTGKFEDFPAQRWSDALMRVLKHVAEEHFVLLLDDYWLLRKVDRHAVQVLHAYADQFRYVLKIDLCLDRMGNDWGRYIQGFNNYGVVEHLDLIHSPPGSTYQMSLWGGLWNRDLLAKFLVPSETAQQIELRGTERVNEAGSNVVVLGTRQAPVIHGNIIQSSHPGHYIYDVGGWSVLIGDRVEMVKAGVWPE